jgi:hypothetical protein
VTDEVRVRLNDLIDKYNQPPSFINLFQGDTIVSKTIGELSEDSNIDEIKKLGQLSSEEKKRLSEINLTLANAELDKFHAKIEDLRDKLNVLSIFKNQLIQAENSLNRTSLNDINASIQIYHNRMSAAKDISSADFKSEVLKHAGTDVWHQFVVSAKKLADVESEQEAVYPQDGDRCLLCQQPLSSDAHNLILRLWKYLESEAQDLVNDALDDLNNKKQILDNLALFDLSFDFSTPYKYVGDYDKRLAQLIINYVTELRERRNKFAASLLSRNKIDVSDLISSFETEIESIIRNIEDELQRLKSVNLDEEILKLTSERLLLEHREILEQILPQVVSYIERLQWIEKAKKAGGNTARITKFHNQLFSSLVTDRYIELFEQNLKSLGRPLKVKVQTKGKKGDTLKQIILVADETAKNIAKPEKVLSEGEKRAVALADFLTEVELDTSSDGIILDDPVTSLDLDWREAIAKVLVSQAEHRQVIVFTHDLPFLHYLMEFSDGKSIKTFTHWVKRGDIDDMPGYTYINNSPALEKSYKKASIAKEWFEKAKSASAEDQEKYLKEGFGALRTSYEAFIVFDMFNEVVMRFNERISFGRLEGIVWSDEISEFVIKKCETLSRYIEGHLHSDAFAAKKPTLDLLKQEINDFENIQRQLKELKKNK